MASCHRLFVLIAFLSVVAFCTVQAQPDDGVATEPSQEVVAEPTKPPYKVYSGKKPTGKKKKVASPMGGFAIPKSAKGRNRIHNHDHDEKEDGRNYDEAKDKNTYDHKHQSHDDFIQAEYKGKPHIISQRFNPDNVAPKRYNPGKKPPVMKVKHAPEMENWHHEVIHLELKTFKNFIFNNPTAVIMFWAPWKPTATQMRTVYGDAAALMNKNNHVTKLAAINCNREKALCRSIDFFPTLTFYMESQPTRHYWEVSEVVGKETVIEFVDWMENEYVINPNTGQPFDEGEHFVNTLEEDGDLEALVSQYEKSLILFYTPYCARCETVKNNYMDAAHVLYHHHDPFGVMAAVDCFTHKELCAFFEVTYYPYIMYYTPHDGFRHYPGGTTKEAFELFMTVYDSKGHVKAWNANLNFDFGRRHDEL